MMVMWLPKVDEGEMCPACGTHKVDPFGINVDREHGARDYADFYEGETGLVCDVMHTRRNHCIYYARLIVDPRYRPDVFHCGLPDHPRGHRASKWNNDCAARKLAEAVERARKVWPADQQEWLKRYATLSDPGVAGQAARLTAMVLS